MLFFHLEFALVNFCKPRQKFYLNLTSRELLLIRATEKLCANLKNRARNKIRKIEALGKLALIWKTVTVIKHGNFDKIWFAQKIICAPLFC